MQRKQPWSVGVALRTLGAKVFHTRKVFTATELANWAPEFAGKPGQARLAIERMKHHQLVKAQPVAAGAVRVDERLRLTARGLAICKAAAQPPDAVPDPAALSTRLWNLLRIRRTLTADDAASSLYDAGERDFIKGRMVISNYLSVWSKVVPDVVQIATKRVNYHRVYVLVKDTGVQPPPTKRTGAVVDLPTAHPAPVQPGVATN